MNVKGLMGRGLLGALLVLAGSLPAAVLPEPQKLLGQMVDASRKMTFHGDFVYQQGGRLETLNVAHFVDGAGVEKERVVYLDGAPREIVRTGNNLTFFNDKQEGVRFEHGSLMPMVGKLSGSISDRHYDLKIAGIDRVVGRESLLLMMIPKDRFRYGYQLWLDRKTSLLLKSIMIDDNGRVMERMQFTRLEVSSSLPDAIVSAIEKKPAATQKVVPVQSSEALKPKPLAWETGWIPDGFAMKNRSLRPSPLSQHNVDALIFSDGIASFSVFVEQDETRVLSQASENIGALAAVSKIYRDGEDYYHVTVIGEVPLSTAERVAVSVRPVKERR
ncbi:MAG: MucB/RseB C-terminal domain-containing protein [Endozoicomonas sp.]